MPVAGAYHDNKDTPNIGIALAIGMTCWSTGEKPYWIDIMAALSDPFLARLPARSKARVGHYERALPQGYIESLTTGKNTITDPMLAKLYNDVALATRGEIWSSARWRAIWRLNTGRYKKLSKHFNRDDQAPWKDLIPAAYKPEGRAFATVIENGYGIAPIYGTSATGAALALGVPPAFSPFIQTGSSAP